MKFQWFEACFDVFFSLIMIKDLFTFRYIVMGNKFVNRTMSSVTYPKIWRSPYGYTASPARDAASL